MSLDENLKSSQQDEDTAAETAAEEAAVSPAADEEEDDRFAAFSQPTMPDDKKKGPKKGMKKQVRSILLSLVAVAALAAILLVILFVPGKEDGDTSDASSSPTQNPEIVLIDKTTKAEDGTVLLKEVTFHQADGDFVIAYSDKEKAHQLKGYEDMELSEYKINSLSSMLTKFTALEKIEKTDNLADYGLDKPVASVDVTYHDDSKKTILIGSEAPSKTGSYAKLADEEGVYVVNSTAITDLTQKKAGFVDTLLVSTPSAKKDDKNGKPVMKEVHLSGKELETPLSIRRATPADGKVLSMHSYIITEPYLRGCDEKISNMLMNYTSLSAREALVLHPTAEDKQKYGFDKPLLNIELTLSVESSQDTDRKDDKGQAISETIFYNSTTSKITVGQKDEDGNYIVMIDGINAIFKVGSTTLSALADRNYDNTVSDMLFLKDITSIGKVRVTANDTVYDFLLKHVTPENKDDEDLFVTYNDKELSTDNFRSLYQLMMGIYRYEPLEKAPEGKPKLTITLWTNDGKEDFGVSFYETSGSLYSAKTDEGDIFKVKASNITHFIEQVNNFINGREVLEKVY